MIPHLDLYRAAAVLVGRYGEEGAPVMAAIRADAMLEAGDLDGYEVWKGILKAGVGENGSVLGRPWGARSPDLHCGELYFMIVTGRTPSGHLHEGYKEIPMYRLKQNLAMLWTDESGISAVEYVLLLAIVGSAIIFGADLLGDAIGDQLQDTAECIASDGVTCN